MSFASPNTGLSGHHVFLQLANREPTQLLDSDVISATGASMQNRIALKAENINITTTKQVPSFPIPFSGISKGESTNLGIDLGMTQKSISIDGVITNQSIQKAYPLNAIDGAGALSDTTLDRTSSTYSGTSPNEFSQSNGFDVIDVEMTAHEVAQMIHSYVDSSIVQRQQNLNELIILYPSFVSKYWLYHNDTIATAATRNVDGAKMVPFNFGSRHKGKNHKLDNDFTIGHSPYPDPFSSSSDSPAEGIKGFIRNFGTTLVGGQPHVEFNLEFEVATVPLG